MFAYPVRIRYWVAAVLLAALLSACNLPTRSESDVLNSPLMQMLRYIPDTTAYRQWVNFGDAAAWHTAWGVQRVDSVDEVMNDLDPKTEKPYWLDVLPHQAAPPNGLSVQYMFTEDQTALFGFSFFNLDSYLEAGQPPEEIMVADFSFDGDQIAAALEALGYASEPMDEGVLYRIREDNEIDIRSEYRTNQMASLNRIVLLEQRLVIGRASALVEKALDTAASDGRSLADNEVFRAAALALADPALQDYGVLVGAMFTHWERLDGRGGLTPEQAQALTESLRDAWSDPLPAYDLACFATLVQEKNTYLVLALVFPEGVDPQAAAEITGARMENYRSIASRQTLEDRWELEKTAGVEANGRPVGLVVMRVIPTELQEIRPGSFSIGVWSWDRMIYQRDVLFLLPEE